MRVRGGRHKRPVHLGCGRRVGMVFVSLHALVRSMSMLEFAPAESSPYSLPGRRTDVGVVGWVPAHSLGRWDRGARARAFSSGWRAYATCVGPSSHVSLPRGV